MEQKQWWKSKTIISLIVAGVGVFAPNYAPFVSDLVGPVVETIGQIVAIVGLIGAAYGRVVAKAQLTATKPEA